jgi:hypothetical protein
MATIALDDFGKIALERYSSLLSDYNSQVALAKSVDSRDSFAESFMANAPDLADINEKIERLEAALEDLLSKRLIAATPLIEPAYEAAVKGAGVDPEALKQQLATVRATAKYLTTMYGDEVLADTPKIETLRTSGGGGSTGGRRIRGVEIYIDGVLSGTKNKDGVFKSTFSSAAKQLGVETVDLQRAFFAEAGQEDVKSESFPTIVEFGFVSEDGEHVVRVVKVDDSSPTIVEFDFVSEDDEE